MTETGKPADACCECRFSEHVFGGIKCTAFQLATYEIRRKLIEQGRYTCPGFSSGRMPK